MFVCINFNTLAVKWWAWSKCNYMKWDGLLLCEIVVICGWWPIVYKWVAAPDFSCMSFNGRIIIYIIFLYTKGYMKNKRKLFILILWWIIFILFCQLDWLIIFFFFFHIVYFKYLWIFFPGIIWQLFVTNIFFIHLSILFFKLINYGYFF